MFLAIERHCGVFIRTKCFAAGKKHNIATSDEDKWYQKGDNKSNPGFEHSGDDAGQ